MLAISVIVCSHNPREDYLRRTLEALKGQTLPTEDWELLLVDNASAPPLAGRVDLAWHPNARHVLEEKVGLTPARLRGIAESKGELLVFVDDDNALRSDYLQNCLKISVGHPWMGVWGGSCIPDFEVEPSAKLRPCLGGLVIERQTTPIWAKMRRGTEAVPPGAGMVVRRSVAEHYRELALHDPRRQMLGRSGKMLGSGEDSDMAICGFDLGMGTGRFPELELTHLIPASRLTLDYLARLQEGFGYCGIMLDAIHKMNSQPGRMRPTPFKIFALQIFMLFSGKSRVERRLRLAEERGRLRAYHELEQEKGG